MELQEFIDATKESSNVVVETKSGIQYCVSWDQLDGVEYGYFYGTRITPYTRNITRRHDKNRSNEIRWMKPKNVKLVGTL